MDIIRKGTKIDTATGYAHVTGFNGHIVYLDMYEANEDGYCRFSEERMLTLSEVGLMMKEFDGRNHKVIWED